MFDYRPYPFVVCPDSGNTYSVDVCDGIHLCSCGCGRNLGELYNQQIDNDSIQKKIVYINTTVVKGRK